MKPLILLLILSLPSLSLAQNLPRNFTCQDLIDADNGKLSRSNDGGRTFVPINKPRPKDAFGRALVSHDTYLCHRLSRGEITVDEFNALHEEKIHQLRGEKERMLADRQKLLLEKKAIENQQRALHNQQQSLQNQRDAVRAQREATVIQAIQADNLRREQEAQHQELMQQREVHHEDQMQQQRIQQQQLEQIRREQARPKSISCFGGGNYIHCN